MYVQSNKTHISCLYQPNFTGQDKYLLQCLLAYRASLHDSTDFFPVKLQYGYEPRLRRPMLNTQDLNNYSQEL
ncbi:LOW QUALITY PROTEIN: hypothetical protein T265_13045 [Opisthorchis viverrini]|uniref:Uncharacterized protein n=1 Tax=Opisthorchis viverrini TaxID=6198 RepID=A0A074ZUJ7_OPIVI|nr:LOW QUALITY PROTEIN: hypothetical protein T265_13045 [Opisthorchis viverrini]KER31128.1 LOW QUALITY PROTEIN: hypothetical protein T265_13045 [Opisthorchis viverrini]